MRDDQLVAEVDRNYDFFQRTMSKYLPDHFGQYALIRHQSVCGFFEDASQAELEGERFADKLYSIQLVDPAPVNLGAYTNG